MIIETVYDTNSKVLEVKADGKKIKNVVDVVFLGFSSDDEFFMDITTIDRSKSDEEGVMIRTHIMASQDGDIKLKEVKLVKTGKSTEETKEDLAKAFN